MNIIIVSRKNGQSRPLVLGKTSILLTSLFVTILMVTIFFAGASILSLQWGTERKGNLENQNVIDAWETMLKSQQEDLSLVRLQASEQIDAITLRMGELQARITRLDALGQRLTEVAKMDNGEFDFEAPPAVGGPVSSVEEESYAVSELTAVLDALEAQISNREEQLELLDEMFVNQQIERQMFVAGRPIVKGWLSSHYGYRTDPFNGKRAWHAGVDFAGKEGSDIIAVASGVVTRASERYGYGQLIEISHSGNVVTRYAHCKKLLVKVGDVVQKGQVIAKMGSSGRSTGPHVHFEVLKNNKTLNPAKFINRASR